MAAKVPIPPLEVDAIAAADEVRRKIEERRIEVGLEVGERISHLYFYLMTGQQKKAFLLELNRQPIENTNFALLWLPEVGYFEITSALE